MGQNNSQISQRYGRRSALRVRKRRRRVIRFVTFILLIAALITGGVLSVVLLPGRNAFYDHISINGIEVKGMTQAQALDVLTRDWQARQAAMVYDLEFEGRTFSIDAAALGVDSDIIGAVEQGWRVGREGNWFRRYGVVRALSQTPQAFESSSTFDESALRAFVEDVKKNVDREVVQTVFAVNKDRKIETTPGQNGYELNADELFDRLAAAVGAGQPLSFELAPKVTQPDIHPDNADEKVQVLASYSTPIMARNQDRTHNIKVALDKFNGFALEPGKQVSFNKRAGRRTVQNGYRKAPEFNDEGVEDGIGGGVCQASSTLYNAAVRAGLEIVRRHPHSKVVTYTKPGMDAAVTSSSKDLVLKNNTNSTIIFATKVTSKKVTVTIYGQPVNPDQVIAVSAKETEVIPFETKYIVDEEGEYNLFYSDEEYVETKGTNGRKAVTYIVYKDRETKETIRREKLSEDTYEPIHRKVYIGKYAREE